uniref:30S ribosomal protein S6, chloroplastic n=1 Tax=Neogoniolithon spectabile TaxID=231755 RepID=A0A3G3MH16_9FLOR|nr:ribosomal protein S6 [Neogoniolithon spectabile]AYR06138.1 ribosomal protein S6 [Neogoniolithon spectabile]
MILNKYELVYILRPDVTESQNLSLINYYKRMLKKHGAQNILIQYKGRRHLSYNIEHYYDGIYVQVDYEGNGLLVETIEKLMRFDEYILRYLTTKKITIFML